MEVVRRRHRRGRPRAAARRRHAPGGRSGHRRARGPPGDPLLNKIDLLAQDDILPLAQRYADAHPFEEIMPVSALKSFNLDRLLALVKARMPLGPAYFPKDQLSEHPERFFVAEIIREQVFRHLRQEVPYATQVNIVQYEERMPPEKDLIDAEIVVERATQKGILIGAKGEMLKRIGTAARREIETFLERPGLPAPLREGARRLAQQRHVPGPVRLLRPCPLRSCGPPPPKSGRTAAGARSARRPQVGPARSFQEGTRATGPPRTPARGRAGGRRCRCAASAGPYAAAKGSTDCARSCGRRRAGAG